MSTVLGLKNTLLDQYIGEIRDIEIQKDSMRFRKNFERIGQIFAYEISKKLDYENKEITTPLGVAEAPVLKNYPVIASILRAGLPLHNGMLSYFDKSENAFISAYRMHHKDGEFDVKVEYVSSPDLTDRTVILCDPMLATGYSMYLTYKALIEKGIPRHTHIVAVIASAQGVDYLKKKVLNKNVTLWVGVIDDELTAQAYIVPGLGDAGDLSFGSKI
jgi:uracil phosphoribosyltransferase